MSVNYHSNVVLGVKIEKDSFLNNRKVRSCNDDVSGEPKFCPECGKPFYRKLTIGHFEEALDASRSKLKFFGNTYSDDCHILVIGILVSSNDEYGVPSSFEPPSDETRNELFEDLKTQGFATDMSQIRLFNIQYAG